MANRMRTYVRTVRLQVGWAPTPLYFAGGPVHYADSRLTSELQVDLETWERRARAVVVSSGELDPAVVRQLRAEALALGARVADELGRDFSVQVLLGSGWRQYRVLRSAHPATNPAAHAAFHRLRRHALTWDRRVRRAVRRGTPLNWPASPDLDR